MKIAIGCLRFYVIRAERLSKLALVCCPVRQLELKLGMELMGAENIHEDKRLAVQEAGRKTGSFNTFIRYLETEGATIYAVLAGPILFS